MFKKYRQQVCQRLVLLWRALRNLPPKPLWQKKWVVCRWRKPKEPSAAWHKADGVSVSKGKSRRSPRFCLLP